MSKLSIIKQEIADFSAQYTGTDQVIADLFNAVDKVQNKKTMSRTEIIDNIEVSALSTLTGDNTTKVFGVLSDFVDPSSPVVVQVFIDAFGSGSQTIINLQASRQETVSRATQLNISYVALGEITNARA